MELEALQTKRELLYREAREIHQQRLVIDRNLRWVTGTDPMACQRRSLLQSEFDDLTIHLRALSAQIRSLSQQIDRRLARSEVWKNENSG
ncbi:hypothetical protein [Gloeobacter kilaueensis]|uniref:Uncharacterized protein n=1 Tax=Gloeobacter kilaueensis (strain ATCC BAA-2537 / CCAP 1431/1 / ULC 316 / JS1) TaxID=1183438 RepID=U5QK88_GLOK1|nr:hypothetical protein [Gloeobacter kilaueensis]AGY59377.1 hypothetical protein GKIL_3131 [Gloeobacter kilaueensis JS1]